MPSTATILLLILSGSIPVRTRTQTLVEESASKRILVPSAAVSVSWRIRLDFDDSAWQAAQGGVGYERDSGYESWIQTDVSGRMHASSADPNNTCYIRILFNADPASIPPNSRLKLNIRFDDGFIACLNGVKIAEANAPASPAWNSAATDYAEAGAVPSSFDVTAFLPALRSGGNLLAVQGLNHSAASSDFLITVSLTLEENPLKDFSSNLPIVILDTRSRDIPNSPKIPADMRILDRGKGERNDLTDTSCTYQGVIGIELRGSSSLSYPKKNYAFETRDDSGNALNVSLLGMPQENDWIFYGPFSDRSLMRDVLMFHVSNEMGRYASRSRYCEMILNGEYRGIYVLLEKIKRDRNRVAIAEMDRADTAGDALTGGYIIKVDKWDGEEVLGFPSSLPSASGQQVYYQYHYPRPDSITQEQMDYIRDLIYEFEAVMDGPLFADPAAGYAGYIDSDSFVDFFILNEICKNVDGYRLSSFMYKDRDSRDGRFHMGPIWDFNLAFGNANYHDAEDTDGWQLDNLLSVTGGESPPPAWWGRLAHEKRFALKIRSRWQEWRSTVLDLNRLFPYIEAVADTLDEAQQRNFEIWPAPGEPGEGFWPVPEVFYSFSNYADEVAYLEYWIEERIAWMDDHIGTLTGVERSSQDRLPAGFSLFGNFPNPFNSETQIRYRLPESARVLMDICDASGRHVRRLADRAEGAGEHAVSWDGRTDCGLDCPTGVYLLKMESGNRSKFMKMVLMR
ncbi:CotH kinase family protein [bacterium]|nr:CotH kinase family protein [bacterium]